MHWLSSLARLEDEGSIRLARDVPLSRYCTIGIGGRAAALVTPRSSIALINVLRELGALRVPYRVIGLGSDVLFDDAGFGGVIINTASLSGLSLENGTLTAQCGVTLPLICSFAAKNSLDGLHGLCGIPGTVGGALATAAGAFGCRIYDHLSACTLYRARSGRVERVPLCADDFSYRSSPISRLGDIVLSAEFTPPTADGAVILRKMSECTKKRRATQPHGEKSAGSYFKRPENAPPAALLIDRAALKGTAVGGAAVSEKHAGFIVNRGGATCADVLGLAEIVKSRVAELFGVTLTEEVIYIPTAF